MTINNFDDAIDESWREFVTDLAMRLGDLSYGGFNFLELGASLPDKDFRVLVRFEASKSRGVRCSIPSDLVRTLRTVGTPAELAQEITDRHRRFSEMGWRYLTRKHEWVIDAGRKRHRMVAAQVVELLRDLWNIPHPTFLTLRDPSGSVTPFEIPPQPDMEQRRHLSAVPDLSIPPTEPQAEPDPTTLAIRVSDCCHLAELVLSWLSATTQRELTMADHGMIDLPLTDALPTRVFVPQAERRVVFTATVCHRLSDSSALATVVKTYSHLFRGITYIVSSDHVYAQLSVDCLVFHPDNMEATLARWRHFVNEIGEAVVRVLNPGGPGAHECAHSTMPVGMQTLLDIFARGELSPEKAAHLANRKVDRLRGYRTFCETMVLDWAGKHRQALAQHAPAEEIDLCAEMTADLRRFADLLDNAISLVTRPQ